MYNMSAHACINTVQGALPEYNYTPIMGVWSIVYIIAIVILGDASLDYGAWVWGCG